MSLEACAEFDVLFLLDRGKFQIVHLAVKPLENKSAILVFQERNGTLPRSMRRPPAYKDR
jgi:hypothetical protein